MIDESDERIKDALYKRIEACGLPVSGDKVDMRNLIKNTTVLRALNMIRLESQAKADVLRTHDLSRQEDINNAIKVQGEANGLLRAIDIFVDIAFSDDLT